MPMKVLERRLSPKQINQHKIINIATLNTGTSILSKSPPKLECKKSFGNTISSYVEDNEYKIIQKTQDYVMHLIFSESMTIEKLSNVLDNNIITDNLNIHEVYTVLASYSIWECMTYLMKNHRVEKISQNKHKFNILHKSLLPSWLWNYRNQIKTMPINFTRTTEDMYKTIEFLVSNELSPSVLDPTPRVSYDSNYKWETSIALISKTIPRELISDIYEKLYNLLVCNLTTNMLLQEINIIIPQISSNDCIQIYKNKLGNELKWLISESVTLVAKKFISYCDSNKKDQTIGNLIMLFELICNEPFQDGIFDDFFAKKPWTKSHVRNLMKEILTLVHEKNYRRDLQNSIISVCFTVSKKNNLGFISLDETLKIFHAS